MLYLWLYCALICGPSIAMDNLNQNDVPQELRTVLHCVNVVHHVRKIFTGPINQLPLEHWIAPPHIVQVSFYDPSIGSATRIIYNDVYELSLPALDGITFDQVLDDSKRIMAQIREEKSSPPFFVMHAANNTLHEKLSEKLLMRSIYKNKNGNTFYTAQ